MGPPHYDEARPSDTECESVHSSQLVMVRVKRGVADSRVQPCLEVCKPINNTSASFRRWGVAKTRHFFRRTANPAPGHSPSRDLTSPNSVTKHARHALRSRRFPVHRSRERTGDRVIVQVQNAVRILSANSRSSEHPGDGGRGQENLSQRFLFRQ